MAGREIVQLYVSAPGKSLDKPSEELKAFAKTGLLAPGKSQTLQFTLRPADLASFDTGSSSWVVESGNYIVKAGNSSLNIRQRASFEVNRDIVTEKDSPQLVPRLSINELRKGSTAFIYELNNFAIRSR
jgi:beta-glucosidase